MFIRGLSGWFTRQPVGVWAAVIAGGFALLVVLVEVVPMIDQIWSDESDLEVLDTSFEETAEATALDIRVRNTSGKVAHLKEANINVEKTWELWSTIFPARVPVSANYDVSLTPDGTPYTRTVKLSQGIDPNEVERFTITFALNDRAKAYSENTNYVFLTTVDLVYDRDYKVTSSEELLFVRELLWQQAKSGIKTYFPYGNSGLVNCYQKPSFRAVRAHNAQVVNEISRIEGTRSQGLDKLIRYISQKS
jgi:hypothetical protein